MKYETPVMELSVLEANDVITLSVNNDYDPTINQDDNNPGSNPWAQ